MRVWAALLAPRSLLLYLETILEGRSRLGARGLGELLWEGHLEAAGAHLTSSPVSPTLHPQLTTLKGHGHGPVVGC